MDQATQLKELGNKEYASRNYIKAIEHYTQAINLKSDPIFYTNRAACNIELKRFDKAIEDVNKAISIDKSYAKAYFRGA